jgi:hypothetical protein
MPAATATVTIVAAMVAGSARKIPVGTAQQFVEPYEASSSTSTGIKGCRALATAGPPIDEEEI